MRSIHTTMANGVPVKVVFVRNRNKETVASYFEYRLYFIGSRNHSVYGIRWDIEVFFKTVKSLLKLKKEFQGRSYDSMISHTTIVFTRYIVLSWQNRVSTDYRTLGGIFYELCDEIDELDWAFALQLLIEILEDAIQNVNQKIKKFIESKLRKWIVVLLIISETFTKIESKVELNNSNGRRIILALQQLA